MMMSIICVIFAVILCPYGSEQAVVPHEGSVSNMPQQPPMSVDTLRTSNEGSGPMGNGHAKSPSEMPQGPAGNDMMPADPMARGPEISRPMVHEMAGMPPKPGKPDDESMEPPGSDVDDDDDDDNDEAETAMGPRGVAEQRRREQIEGKTEGGAEATPNVDPNTLPAAYRPAETVVRGRPNTPTHAGPVGPDQPAESVVRGRPNKPAHAVVMGPNVPDVIQPHNPYLLYIPIDG